MSRHLGSAFALNSDNDIYASAGSLVRNSGSDYVVQTIRTQLLMYQGEWWLDLTAGIPWFQTILAAPADIKTAEQIIKTSILGTPGVTELVEFDATFDNSTRDFKITFIVLTEYGPSGEVVVSG